MRTRTPAPAVRRGAAAAAVLVALPAAGADRALAAPAPCGGTPNITDPAGDGHHPNTDVVSAWLSEADGRLQAVIRPKTADWTPAHDDSASASWAFLYEQAGARRYVRVTGPRTGPARFDAGTWSPSGGFASNGPVAGTVSSSAAIVDLPPVAAGTKLATPFVLTSDGDDAGGPHWVDRAPGGTSPAEAAFGADFVAGACGTAAPPVPRPDGVPAPPASPDPLNPSGIGSLPDGTSAVVLRAPQRVRGGGTAELAGRVVPARGGVEVGLVTTALRSTTHRVRTAEDGTFAHALPVSETTSVRAVAGGVGSQTQRVTVLSTVSFRVRRVRGGGVVITGRVRPALPGRVQLLRSGAVRPTAATSPRRGTFSLRLRRPRPGRYQALFLPAGRRAERSLSQNGAIR